MWGGECEIGTSAGVPYLGLSCCRTQLYPQLGLDAPLHLMSGTTSNTLELRLTEAVVFLRGALDLTSNKSHSAQNAPPALLRGLLVFQVDKPVKVKSIEVEIEGRTRTEWPEGSVLSQPLYEP